MGAILDCLNPPMESSVNVNTPDPEERRRQMLEAAERRKVESDARGLKNPEKFHEQQKVLNRE